MMLWRNLQILANSPTSTTCRIKRIVENENVLCKCPMEISHQSFMYVCVRSESTQMNVTKDDGVKESEKAEN